MSAVRLLSTASLAVALAGCATGSGTLDEGSAGVLRGGALPPSQAQAQVLAGTSTREQVAAALGPANVIAFDSGWQVWVYRWLGPDRSTQSATELVVLFDPSGVARKVRVRPR